MTKRLVIANWKMNGSRALVKEAAANFPAHVAVDVVVVPPSLYVLRLCDEAMGRFEVGLQNVCEHEAGAHTGEVSAAMAGELGATAVLVGHSERRSDRGEDDEMVAAKCVQIVRAGLMPVICVGESLIEREAGDAETRVQAQVKAQAACLQSGANIAIAYEPIWAIGTGKSAGPDEAVAMHREIRKALRAVTPEHAEQIRILYGGSVNGENAPALFAHEEIQGVLVGGASLDTAQFAAIIRAAEALPASKD